MDEITNLTEEEWQTIPGYLHLNKKEQDLIKRTYIRHMRGMGTEDRKQFYGADKIKKVESGDSENVHIFFEGIWWHYTPSMEWY